MRFEYTAIVAKTHLVDLMEVTAPDLEISMGEFAWHVYRGLEDHQMGSKATTSTSTSSRGASRLRSPARRQPSSSRCSGVHDIGRFPRPEARRSGRSTPTRGRSGAHPRRAGPWWP